jgi:glycosyltransferase involved in cell wall biosynthesis
MDSRDSKGYNLDSFVSTYNLKGRVIINPVSGGKEGPEDNQLCEIYNTFDVHVCPFRGEGFGLPIAEGLACGVRTIATNFSTPAEFGKGVIDFVEPVWTEPIVSTNCEWAVLNPNHVGDAINRVYADSSTKEPYIAGVKAMENYSEPVVANKWLKLIRELNIPDTGQIDEDVLRVQSANTTDSIIDGYLDSIEA